MTCGNGQNPTPSWSCNGFAKLWRHTEMMSKMVTISDSSPEYSGSTRTL